MRRRQFIALLGGAAALPARAQQAAMPVIGFFHIGAPAGFAHIVAGFRRGLDEAGFAEGRNVAIEYRWAEYQDDRLPALVADLVRRPVDVVVAGGGERSAIAAKAATSTIPIVFAVGGDPVKLGLVASLNRPGGNLTGLSQFAFMLEAKRLALLHEVVPRADTIAVLLNPSLREFAAAQLRDAQEGAARSGVRLVVLNASVDDDFEPAFAALGEQRAGALVVAAAPFFNSRRKQLVALAERHRVPAIYEWREFAEAGGLMSYGTSLVDAYRQMGVYAGRILKGAKPADLPVTQPTKLELIVNLKTATALGIVIPPAILLGADEVIE